MTRKRNCYIAGSLQIRKGWQAFNQAKYELALTHITTINDKNSVSAGLLRARCYDCLNDFAKAKEVYNVIIKNDVTGGVYVAYYHFLRNHGEQENAASILEEAYKRFPYYPAVAISYAEGVIQKNKHQQAYEIYQSVKQRIGPENPCYCKAWLGVLITAERLQKINFDTLNQEYQALLQEHSHYLPAQLFYAIFLKNSLKQPQQAIPVLKQLETNKKLNKKTLGVVLHNLSHAYTQVGKVKMAEEINEKINVLLPNYTKTDKQATIVELFNEVTIS